MKGNIVEENKEIQTEQETPEVDAVENEEVAEVETEVEAASEESIHQEEAPQQGKKASRRGQRRKIETVEPVESEWKEQVVQISRVTNPVR